MDYKDLRIDRVLTLTGVVHGISMLDSNDNDLPLGVVDVRLRVILADQDSTAGHARHALEFVDQTMYANRDSSAAVTWRNDEVMALLDDIRVALIVGPKPAVSERSTT